MKVDIIGLQEVDNLTVRTPNQDQMKILSSLTRLPYFRYGKNRDMPGTIKIINLYFRRRLIF
jgi:hypothetical protein